MTNKPHLLDQYASNNADPDELATMQDICDRVPEGVSKEDFTKILLWVGDQATIKQLQKILDAPVVGNAMSDQPLMDRIHKFVTRGAPIELKIKALEKLGDVMGLTDPVTANTVRQYLEES